MDNVINLDIGDKRKVTLGPRRNGRSVIVEGRCIPKLIAHERGAQIEFILDDRFMYTIDSEWSLLFASAVAQALAIGSGFSSLNSDGSPRCFAPKVINIELDE